MASRRRFLSLLGVGAVSAPVMAKAAADAEIASLTTLRGEDASPIAGGLPTAIENKTAPKMASYLKLMGRLPKHVEENVRNRSSYVHCLDPDIASKRTWSMQVKIMTQRQRNYEREIERYRTGGTYDMAQDQFEKLTGFRWDQW